jgi:Lipase (class 3)
MLQYAFDEVSSLVNSLSTPIDVTNPVISYLCAVFAESAYYHIPQWEIDDTKRAKLIPCDAYRSIVASGNATDLKNYFQEKDFNAYFTVEDRGVVAVGVVFNNLLFVGFRGTQFLFDWRINFRSRLTSPSNSFYWGHRYHSGFAEEALRITLRVFDAIEGLNLGQFEHVFLSGHSLGGAVAAISGNLFDSENLFCHSRNLRFGRVSVRILGSPRYANLTVATSHRSYPPIQFRRAGDIVATIPPKLLGYADHLFEFDTNGKPYIDHALYSLPLGGFFRWAQFFLRCFKPHMIEIYRSELGGTADTKGAKLKLAPIEKLTRATVCP